MASINYATREISCKIVYYGPGLSGKTTNLQIIHRKIPDKDKSEMVSLATETDRTLFFDFLPLDLGSIKGFATKFQLYTVPGQVYYNATRKLVLRGVDGVVFVVDSQADKLQENLESFQNLQENLREYGHSIETIPVVLQYNKRDMPGIYSVDQLNSLVNKYGMPYFEAVASTGVGVFTTLKGIGKSVIDKFNAKYSGFQGSRRPAASPAASAGTVPATPKPAAPQPQSQPQFQPQPQPQFQPQVRPQGQPQPQFQPPAQPSAFPQSPFGGMGARPPEMKPQPAPLSQAPGPQGPGSLGPFQTPSANPYQSMAPGLGGPGSPFGNLGGNSPNLPAQPGPQLGNPSGQFVPPTGGPKPFAGFGGPGLAPIAPAPGLGQPFGGQPLGGQAPGGQPMGGKPGFGAGVQPNWAVAPAPQQPQPQSQAPVQPQFQPLQQPQNPFPVGNAGGAAGIPFTPQVEGFGGFQGGPNPTFGAPQQAPAASPFGGLPSPGANQNPSPFGGGPRPFSPPGQSPFGQAPNTPAFGNPQAPVTGQLPGGFGGQPGTPFGGQPQPGAFGGSFGQPSNAPVFGGGQVGPAFGNLQPQQPQPQQAPQQGQQPQPQQPAQQFQPQPSHSFQPNPQAGMPAAGAGHPPSFTPQNYSPGVNNGPSPMPPLGETGNGGRDSDNHSGIVSTYEDMQRDENFKTRKLPLPGEKKKGFFDGLFKKDK